MQKDISIMATPHQIDIAKTVYILEGKKTQFIFTNKYKAKRFQKKAPIKMTLITQ